MTSSTSRRAHLGRVFRRTAYCFREGNHEFELRIGIHDAHLDVVLDRRKARCWTMVTAWNPTARPLDARTNRRREEALERSLRLPFVPSEGRSLEGNWNPEVGVMVFGLTARQARRLCGRWEQAAAVVGVRGGKPRLLWGAPEYFA